MAGFGTLRTLRQSIGDYLELRSIEKHRSKLGRSLAPRYTNYLRECRQRFQGTIAIGPEVEASVREFGEKNVATFWTPENRKLSESILQKVQAEEKAGRTPWNEKGQYIRDVYMTFPEIEELFKGTLGSFLAGSFRAPFKIFYGMLFKSEHLRDVPINSELWHADGGPGTCIIVMFYLKDVAKEDGALECLPWDYSLEAFRNERAIVRKKMQSAAVGKELSRDEIRKIKCDYYKEAIERSYLRHVEQPVGQAGLVVAFGNNLLHKGGYPAPGRTRYACLFHCYPSDRPTPFERYRQVGIKKVESFPKDPAAEF